MQQHQSTEGEKIIEYFLEDQGIRYEREVNIPKLKGDAKDYRIADFYLPRYKVYVEFLGKWNNEKNKQGYHEKQKIYELNRIPCIYLYPDNLGILNDIFRMRLQDQLDKYPELTWQRFLFRFAKLKKLVFVCLTFWIVFSLLFIVIGNIHNKNLVIDDFSLNAFVISTLATIALLIYGANLVFAVKKKH